MQKKYYTFQLLANKVTQDSLTMYVLFVIIYYCSGPMEFRVAYFAYFLPPKKRGDRGGLGQVGVSQFYEKFFSVKFRKTPMYYKNLVNFYKSCL